MFSTRTKVLGLAGIFILSIFFVFAFTDTGSNMAAVITGVSTDTQKCIQELAKDTQSSDYETRKVRLNDDSQDDYVLKAISDEQCGSAGCVHELCVIEKGSATIVPFGYATENLIVKNTLTSGMHDIQLKGKSTTNLQWEGTRYIVIE